MTTLTLESVLDRLAEYASDTHPVTSLYLDLRPNQNGRDNYEQFIARSFKEQLESFDVTSEKRASLEHDIQRIQAYIGSGIKPSSQALAIFACSGDPDLFEAHQLEAAIDGHRLYVGREPHLFPLARLADQNAPNAVLLVNTNTARLYVFAIGGIQRQLALHNEKGSRVSTGGWAQARFQRHVENLHLKHMKEVAEHVERVVRVDGVERILVAGDEVAVPLLKEQLSKDVLARIFDVMHLDIRTPGHEVLSIALETFRRADAETDKERMAELLDEYRSGGLATVGVERVKAAFELGQVDRLFVPAIPSAPAADEASPTIDEGVQKEQRGKVDEQVIEYLVTQAKRTDAAVTFIEDATLLEPVGGVGALLRFKL